jgi:hypothetical protein
MRGTSAGAIACATSAPPDNVKVFLAGTSENTSHRGFGKVGYLVQTAQTWAFRRKVQDREAGVIELFRNPENHPLIELQLA